MRDSENQQRNQQGDGDLSSVGSSPQTCRPVANTSASSFDKGVQHEPIPRSVESAADHGDQSTQCVHQAREEAVDAPDSLTLLELRALVKRNRASHGYMRGPSDPNDLMQQIQKGTLAELKIFAQKHQINHAANISHGDLRLHLRRWLYRSGTPETVVSFGRHQGKTFQEVLGWQLVQLVTWAVLDGHLDSPFDSDMKGHAAKTKHSHGTELESILAIDPDQYKIPENDLNQDKHIKKKQANGLHHRGAQRPAAAARR